MRQDVSGDPASPALRMRRTGFDETNPSSVASDITLWSIPMMLVTLFPVSPPATRRRRNSFTRATSTSRRESRPKAGTK
jgi:hypothetical protein